MSRSLTVLFRRDPSKDRQHEKIRFEGFRFIWPDGRPVAVGLDAFCKQGTRFFGLHKHLVGREERLIKLVFLPLTSLEDELNHIPGFRVRRLYMQREGLLGRVHFIDGTPTSIVFDIDRDEACVLEWLGLPAMVDGEKQWFDIAAMPVEIPVELPLEKPIHHPMRLRQMAMEAT